LRLELRELPAGYSVTCFDGQRGWLPVKARGRLPQLLFLSHLFSRSPNWQADRRSDRWRA